MAVRDICHTQQLFHSLFDHQCDTAQSDRARIFRNASPHSENSRSPHRPGWLRAIVVCPVLSIESPHLAAILCISRRHGRWFSPAKDTPVIERAVLPLTVSKAVSCKCPREVKFRATNHLPGRLRHRESATFSWHAVMPSRLYQRSTALYKTADPLSTPLHPPTLHTLSPSSTTCSPSCPSSSRPPFRPRSPLPKPMVSPTRPSRHSSPSDPK